MLVINKEEEQEKRNLKKIFFLMAAIYCEDHHLTEKNKISVSDLEFPKK